jgi:hypothetical protein
LKQAKFPDRTNVVQSSLNRARLLARADGLNTTSQILVFGAVLLALFSRRPSLLTHAQFYAEDGTFWFAQAYNFGWLHSLLLPQAGYLNTMPRVAAGIALLVPLEWAPLAMATVGLLIQALPVPILLSSRMCRWGSLPTRLLMATAYVAMPNTREIHIVATNTLWHLALAAALVALANSPRTWLGRFLDIVLVLAASLSGPFCILLAPIVLIFWWLRRQPWTFVIFLLMTIAACTQIAVLLHNPVRAHAALGARPDPLARIVGGNIIAGALFGGWAFASKAPVVLLLAAAIVGISILIYCFSCANLEWKLFQIYCVAVCAASLASPLVAGDRPLWELLVYAVSSRYWFLPMTAFAWSAIWCVGYAPKRLFRMAGISILLCMPIGIVHDWRYLPFATDHSSSSILLRMRKARQGEHLKFPIEPDGWQMELVKKSS